MSMERFLKLSEVLQIVGCSKTTWYRIIKNDKSLFPYRPYGDKAVRWKMTQIHDWVKNNNYKEN